MDSKELDKIKDQLLQFVNGAKGATPLVRFIPLVCALDAASNYWCGRANVDCCGFVFKAFVRFYMKTYERFSNLIYSQLRCKLVHSFTLGEKIVLTSNHSACHCKYYDWNAKQVVTLTSDIPTTNNPLIINVEDFDRDVRAAIECMFDDAKASVKAPKIVTIADAYYYSFKGDVATDAFGCISDFDYVAKHKKGAFDTNDSAYCDWLAHHREVYGELHKKWNFMEEVRKETMDDRLLSENIISASKRIRLLRVALGAIY